MREKFVSHILAQCGKPYIWGGDGRKGYDCSGLIIDGLQAAGSNITDHTSSQLAVIFEHAKTTVAKPGCLTFYGDEKGIFHIMAVANVWSNDTIHLSGLVVVAAEL